jgi:hypothetical protein
VETSHPELVPHRFEKGVSGNPNGRPRGIVAVAKALTHDGADLSRFMWRIYRGKSLGDKEVVRVVVKPDGTKEEIRLKVKVYPTVDQRMEAATWLAERGWGKPRQTHELVSKRITVFRQSDGTPLALQPAQEEPVEP